LHVVGNSANSAAANMRYFNHSFALSTVNNWSGSTAIFAEGNICASEAFISSQSFNFSDARIKKIIGLTDNLTDLERLRNIEVTRYRYLDSLTHGTGEHAKVIAQQLKEVLPEAVSYRTLFIPSIIQLAKTTQYHSEKNELTLTIEKPADIPTGAKVKCYTEKGTELLYTFVSANGNNLTLSGPAAQGNLFVYGHEVNDFHVVDYNAISMLNVSATQALLKRIEELEEMVRKLQK
jgi:hypothetical protein